MSGHPGALHVCHVSAGLDHGGLEQLLVELAERTTGEVRHSFISLGGLGHTAQTLAERGHEVLSVDLLGDRRAGWGRLVRALGRLRPDLVHAHNTYAQWFAAGAAVRVGIGARITTQHGPGGGDGWRLRGYYLAGNRLVDRIVAVSQDGLERCRRQDRLAGRKLVLVPNGIAVGAPAAPGPRVGAVAVGRLSPEKDHESLITAWAGVVHRHPGATLHVLGEGPSRPRLEGLVERLGLGGQVVLEGYRDDVGARLAQARLYVSSSRREGLSLALLEAMAAGTCCVVTDVGDHAAVLGPDPYGAVVAPGDVAAMTAAIVGSLDADPDPVRADRAYRRVRDHFSADAMSAAYLALYRDVVGR